mmetsp:Transcript_49515/g.124702  ORF Transcript_49515/g.124702 Transcript_49515/m.124702 type:complete len:236 (+) Transcript_49515:3393-4100(+)
MRSALQRCTEASRPSTSWCSRRPMPRSRNTVRRPGRSFWPSMVLSTSLSTMPSSTATSSMPSSWPTSPQSTSCQTFTSRRRWRWRTTSSSSWQRTSLSRQTNPRRRSICTSTSATGSLPCGLPRTTTGRASRRSWSTMPKIWLIRTTCREQKISSSRQASQSWPCRLTPPSAWSMRQSAFARSIARRCSATSLTPTVMAGRAEAASCRAWKKSSMRPRSTRRPATIHGRSTRICR